MTHDVPPFRSDDGFVHEAPAAKLLDGLVVEAIRAGRERLRIRLDEGGEIFFAETFDGSAWGELFRGPVEFFELLIRRLKVVANLDLVRRLPFEERQCRLVHRGRTFDLTIAIRHDASGVPEAIVGLSACRLTSA